MSNPHRRARRAKRYVPKTIRQPMLIAAELVLRPIDQIIDQLERNGMADVDDSGRPVFLAGDGRWYDAAEAIEGVIWHYEAMEVRHKLRLPLQPLRDLHTAFKFDLQIHAKTLDELREAMPSLRRALSLSDPDDALDLLQQVRIKSEMELNL